ncbi:MAG: hypothetical protein OXG11_01815 [Chloroflexi bacterium]|nr:hypothetical protein [Chloroflexota bacterium]
MKSLNRRLDDLDDSLSPTDIVLRWVRKLQKLPDTADLATALRDLRPAGLVDQARHAVTRSLKGHPRGAVDRRAHTAARDVIFLVNLHSKLNSLVRDELSVAAPCVALLSSELSRELLRDLHRDRAIRAWLLASRAVPYPLDRDTATALKAAGVYQVESWTALRDGETIEGWVYEELESEDDDQGLDEASARIPRQVERELRRLVRSGEVRAGKVVCLDSSPHPFLATAPLLDGRWIDATVVEVAELGCILEDRGYSSRDSADAHPLAFEEFVRTDADGYPSPLDDESWLDAREAAADRVRSYRGRRRTFSSRDYVNLSLYQKWRIRRLGARLGASIESGFVVSSWNDWVRRQRPQAALVGVQVDTIEPWCADGHWTVGDGPAARRLQAARRKLLGELRSAAIDNAGSTARSTGKVDAAAIPWRDHADNLVTLVDGLAAAADRISATYFRNHPVVFDEFARELEGHRSALRELIELSSAQSDREGSTLASLGSESGPHDGGVAGNVDQADDLRQAQERVARTAAHFIKEVVREARLDTFASIGDSYAARSLIDEQLESLFP